MKIESDRVSLLSNLFTWKLDASIDIMNVFRMCSNQCFPYIQAILHDDKPSGLTIHLSGSEEMAS